MVRTAARIVGFTIVASIGGCGDATDSATEAEASPNDADLKQAIEDYWDLLAHDRFADAYTVLSEGCRDQIGRAEFAEGFEKLFAQAASDGFERGAQVVRVDIDTFEAGADEGVRTAQWSLAPVDDPTTEETLSITGGDQDVWVFDGAWHPDVPECGGGVIAADQADEAG